MADLTLANSTYQSGTNDTATTLVDNVDTIKAQHPNGANSAIVQIETVLGQATSLVGNKSDLKTRLNVQMDADGNLCPVGSILMHAGSSAPTGWLLCDGSAVNRITYANLFAVISTTYGSGDGSTTFNVPDMRGRVAVGVGTGTGGGASGTGLPSGGAALTAVARGTWKGEETHTLTVGELAAHTHSVSDPTHSHTIPVSNEDGAGSTGNKLAPSALAANDSGGTSANHSLVNAASTGVTTPSTGSNTPHNNIQPVMGVNFIIRT